jgi:hypothetical protein
MTAQDQVVLPGDVRIVPLSELPSHVRSRLGGDDGDFAITRPHSRTPSKVIDANAAALLKLFEKPKTLVEAITEYCRAANLRPLEVLDEAYPLIESCLEAHLLVPPGTAALETEAAFAMGESIGSFTVESVVQVLDDSEVYRVRSADGQAAALKLSRRQAGSTIRWMLQREETIIRHLDGCPGPRFLAAGTLDDGRRYLVTEWFEAIDVQAAAARIRERTGSRLSDEMADLGAAVIEAYAALHDKGVIHADVHPRNVLVTADGEVRLVDYGTARLESDPENAVARAGVGFFFEPEYAVAMRNNTQVPPATVLGEQYAVAALVYLTATGDHYADFSFEKNEMMRQIAETEPVPMLQRGVVGAETLEAVLWRALAKDAAARFPGTRAFATAFREACQAREMAGVKIAVRQEARRRVLERVLDELSNAGSTPDYKGPVSPTASVTYGSAGIALGLHSIARARDDEKLAAIADSWAEQAAAALGSPNACYAAGIEITPETVGRISPYHTPSGIAAVQVMLAQARGDHLAADRALGRFMEWTEGECDNPDLTLGRSSVVVALSLLLDAAGKSKPEAFLRRGGELLEGVWGELDCEPVIGEGGKTSFLGIAHGWAGYLYATLRWRQAAQVSLRTSWQERLEQLFRCAQLTRRGARWAIDTGPDRVSVPGWCNGSAGYAHLWSLAHEVYGEDRYLDLAVRAAHDAWEGGGAGHALCCGAAGQAYAQLVLFNATGDRQWLDRAHELTERAAETGEAMRAHQEDALPYSLYKGDLGVAVLAAELERPEWAAMPFFGHEAWR